jgi:MFS family permease
MADLPERIEREDQRWIYFSAGAVAFALIVLSSGIRSGMRALPGRLGLEFTWGAQSATLALSIAFILYGIVPPLAAACFERYGMRRTMAVSIAAAGIAALASLAATQAWEIALTWGAVIGVMGGVLSLVIGAGVISRWFVRGQGFAMGLITSAPPAGLWLFGPAFAAVANQSGWRAIAILAAAICGVLLLLVLKGPAERPGLIGLPPLGGSIVAHEPVRKNPLRIAGESLFRAAATWDFWLIGLAYAICGATTGGLMSSQLPALCGELGASAGVVPTLVTTMLFFTAVGPLVSGWLTDRIPSRTLLFVMFFARGVSLLFVPQIFGFQADLWLFAAWYGLDWIATVPPLFKLQIDTYGAAAAPVVFGWFLTWHQIGVGLWPVVAKLSRGYGGTTSDFFFMSGLVLIWMAGTVLLVGLKQSGAQRAAA